jgi:four helix bundle protein
MSLALKECAESKYWIRLIRDTNIVNNSEIDKLLDESEEIRKILTSIIKTSQQNNKS